MKMLIINRHIKDKRYISLVYSVSLFEDFGIEKYNFKFNEGYYLINEIDYLITNSFSLKFTLLNYKHKQVKKDNNKNILQDNTMYKFWTKRIEFCKGDLFLIENGQRLF